MTTLTRSWTVSQNVSLSDQTATDAQTREILYDIKTKLIAAGWTVTQSSDGSSSGTSDLWSDADGLTSGTGAHSWIVLKSPAGFAGTGEFIYYAIDYNDSTNTRCHFASRGDQDWSGLTTSSGPTDNDTTTINLWNYYYGNQIQIVPSSLTNCKKHCAYTSTGDFIYYVSNTAKQQANFAIIINKCSQTESADVYPIVHYQWGYYSTSSTITGSAFYHQNLENDQNAKGFNGTTGVGSGNYSQGGSLSWPNSADFWAGAASSNTGDQLTGKMPAVPIFFSCRYPTSGSRIVGQLTDIFACQGYSSSAGTYVKASIGDVVPGTGSITQGCVGGVWVPCTEAPDFS